MHKLLALVMVAILSSNVIASDGGINEETSLNETDFQSMEYNKIVYAEQEFTISLTLKNGTTNLSHINWITQVCINSGVCYPPKTIQMNTSDNVRLGIISFPINATITLTKIENIVKLSIFLKGRTVNFLRKLNSFPHL